MRVESRMLLPKFRIKKKEYYSSICLFSCSFLTFVVVVLHCDDATSGGPGVIDDGLGVQRFDGEKVDHADVNSF